MNELEFYEEKIFEDIKHINECGLEYCLARELIPLLEYKKWENFHQVIKRAMIACKSSNNSIEEQFPKFKKPILGGNGNTQYIVDYKLSRYACYLIAQNGDSNKKAIAMSQTYFAIQTRNLV